MRVLFITILLSFFNHSPSLNRIDGSRLTVKDLDKKVRFLIKDANVSGLAITVFNNNKNVYSNTFGLADVQKAIPLNDSSVMYAASLAKMVFAYISMQMVEEKLLDLDRPLVNYLNKPLVEYKLKGWKRGYQDIKNDERYKKITARMCLSHTTGFPNWRWFEADKKLKIKFDPGTRYSYSGEGLYLLQFVIEQITGKDYETISKERVFIPLKMTSTSQLWQKRFENNISYGHDNAGKPYELKLWDEASAGGSMSTTLSDFNKFYTAFISGSGLSKETFNQITTPQIRIRSQRQFGPLAFVDSSDNDNIKLSYGLGVGLISTPYGKAFFKEGHDYGWQHYCICYPDKKIAILIMTNNDNGESIFKDLLQYAIGDTYTPSRWEDYIPYNKK